MDFPKYATITVRKRVKIDYGPSDWDKEYFEREGFTEEEVQNSIESNLRDEIWEYINDNDINITFD